MFDHTNWGEIANLPLLERFKLEGLNLGLCWNYF